MAALGRAGPARGGGRRGGFSGRASFRVSDRGGTARGREACGPGCSLARRARLRLPSRNMDDGRFRRTLRIRAEHVDELGHVNNLVWVRLILELGTAHSNAVGLDTRAYRELGAWWIVHRQEIDYHAPAFPGEEVVEETWISSMRGARCVRESRFTRVTDSVVALGAHDLGLRGCGKPPATPHRSARAGSVARRLTRGSAGGGTPAFYPSRVTTLSQSPRTWPRSAGSFIPRPGRGELRHLAEERRHRPPSRLRRTRDRAGRR